MPTTTVAVSSPLNPTSTVTSSQNSVALKDDAISIINLSTTSTTISQTHDTSVVASPVILIEAAKLSPPTLLTSLSEDVSHIVKDTVNENNNAKNGSISTLLSNNEQCSPKIALHSPIPTAISSTSDAIDVDLNIKTADINCLNVITSSPSVGVNSVLGGGGDNFSNGHLLMTQNSNSSLNFQPNISPTADSWSMGDDNAGFVNYASLNNGQLHKRPIMSQQPHHGISPNSSIARASNSVSQQQQFPHYNKNNSNNFSSAWSNHSGQNPSWQNQQQQQQQQMQLIQSTSSSSISQTSLNASWNRGCSVANLNPLSPHNHNVMHQQQRIHQNTTQYSMPSSASSSQQHHQPPHQGLSPNLNSPSKYRRNTSYSGKSQMHAFPIDIGTMIEDQSAYMNYKVRYIASDQIDILSALKFGTMKWETLMH